MSMPPNVLPAAGLLTTLPQQQPGGGTASNPLNTAYPLHSAIYFPNQFAQQPDFSSHQLAVQQQRNN